MRNLLTIILSALCFGCGAQFPPPFIHNYWDTNASPNSPIMNVAKEVTNNINADTGLFRSVRTFGNLTATSTNTIPLVVDDFTGTNIIAEFVNAVNGRSAIISSNADISIGAGIYSGDGSGLTNLPSSGGSGTVIWNTNAAGTLATNTFSKANISFNLGGGFTATSFNGSGSGLTAVSIPDSALQPDVVVLSAGVYPAGDGHLITTLNASQLTSGTVPDARLSANLAYWSTNSQASVTAIPNTNATTGMNFGGTVTISNVVDFTVTNNTSGKAFRTVSFMMAFVTGAGAQPGGPNLGTNVVSAFTTTPNWSVCMVGSQWNATSILRALAVEDEKPTGCSVRIISSSPTASTVYKVAVTGTGPP